MRTIDATCERRAWTSALDIAIDAIVRAERAERELTEAVNGLAFVRSLVRSFGTSGENPRDHIYYRAISIWGRGAQLRMLAEECCELAVAVSHHERGRDDTQQRLVEEIADVEIMIEQARRMVGDDRVDDAKARKLARLLERIEAAEASHG